MKKWLTLAGFCLVTMVNAMGFGIFSDNHAQIGQFYNMPKQEVGYLFYVGLFIQFLFCVPVIRLLEWRLDYSLKAAAYLTFCAYILNLFKVNNIVIAYASQVLCSIAQLLILPTSLYLAEIWFDLEQRSLAIGLGFYFDIFGFGLGGILISLIGNSVEGVETVMIIMSSMAGVAFLLSLFLISNQPEVKVEKKKKVKWVHLKELWKQKYIAYNAITSSAFLGAAWTFQSQYSTLEQLFGTHQKVSILMLIWILAGGGYGVFMSWGVQIWVKRTGDFKYYDWACKVTLLVGFIGFIIAGILVQIQFASFPFFVVLVFFMSIGSLGFFGLNFLSLIQSLYPIPVLVISTIIAAFGSLYSAMAVALNELFVSINPYFCIAIVLFLPLLYIIMCYETTFKRYKYYLNDKETKYELLKIDDQMTIKEE